MADYDELADLYFKRRRDKTRFDFNRDIEVPAMIKIMGNVKGKKILDLGCGFGDHAKKLSKQKFRELIGIDVSRRLLEYAAAQKIPNAKFYCGDMSKPLLYPNSSFDIVTASLSIHYIKNLKSLFSQVHRVLKKGGIFCFSTAHPIFNLLNSTESHEISAKRQPDGKRQIIGNYFFESFRESYFGQTKLYNYTFQTLIKRGLDAGFELEDYVDAKPVPSAKKIDSEKYILTTTLPSVILFRFRKK